MQQVKPGSPWTPAELDILRQRSAEGWRWGTIAKEIGRSDEAVATKARSLGLTAWDRIRLWTKEEDEILIKMRAKGVQNKDIGEVLNRNRGAIDKRVKLLGLTKPKPMPRLPETEAESAVKAWVPAHDGLELMRLWEAANQRVASRNNRQTSSTHVGVAQTPSPASS